MEGTNSPKCMKIEHSHTFAYIFHSRYTNGLKSRMIKNVKKGTAADDLKKVGQAIAGLQEDSLDDVILVQKQRVIEAAE